MSALDILWAIAAACAKYFGGALPSDIVRFSLEHPNAPDLDPANDFDADALRHADKLVRNSALVSCVPDTDATFVVEPSHDAEPECVVTGPILIALDVSAWSDLRGLTVPT
jgi:hypothetical protein